MLTHSSDLGTDFVKITVGTDSTLKTFAVHENLLCERSGFFRTCLNGKWKESDDRNITLPDDDPSIIQLYIQSLYVSLSANIEV
jgi:hypothetical protein